MRQLEKETAILVTGVPGTGKTNISRLLARRLRARYVNPASVLTRRGTSAGYDRTRRTRIVPIERLQEVVSLVGRRNKRGLVVDSHIAFKINRPVIVVRVIILRCHPRALEMRLRQKHWSKRKISENLLAEILDICLWDTVHSYGWNKITEIDTTEMNPSCAVDLVMAELDAKRSRKRPKVDWLSALQRERTLMRYLR